MGTMSYNSIKYSVAVLLALAITLLGNLPARAAFSDIQLNSMSGASTMQRTDLTHGKIFPISIERQYNSKSGFVGPLGYGWALSYDKQLFTYPDGSVIVRKGPGMKNKFTAAAGGFASPLTDPGILKLNSDGTYTYTAQGGTQELYDLYGRLASITDPKGTSLALTYESNTKSPLTGLLPWNIDQTTPQVVANVYHLSKIEERNAAGTATGKWVTFTYDPTTGMLTGLSDNLGRSVAFGHDAIGNLTSVAGPGVAASYGYADPNNKHLLTSIGEGHGTYASTYDSAGRVVQQTHGNTTIAVAYTIPRQSTKVTTTVKDTSGKITSTETLTVAFDAQGQVVSETDTLGNQIKNTRNSQTWITRKEWWQNTGTASAPNLILDHAVDYTYDAKGNMLTSVEPNGTTTYTYDAAGNMLSSTNHLNQTTTYTYNGANQVLTTTGPQGNTSNTYDASGNLLTVTDLAGAITSFTYDAMGNISTITNANNQATANSYDANDNLVSVTDPTGVKTSYTYDVNGNTLTWTDPVGKTTAYTYDTMNRLVKVTDPLNHVTTYTFDANGNRSVVTDANGNSTSYTFSDQGQVTSVKDALGSVTTHNYGGTSGTGCPSCGGGGGGINILVALSDAKGQTTSYQYDFLNRVTQETDPLQKAKSYVYDPAGNLVSKIDANGSNLRYSYDPLKRLTGKTYPDGSTVAYTYDQAGRIQTAANKDITYTYSYDAGSRVTSVTDSRGYFVSYQYDALGNQTQMTAFGNANDQRTTTYGYDNANRLQTITSPAGLFTYGYDGAGRRSSLAYPNRITANYTYDDASRLTNLTHQVQGGAAIATYTYTHDNVGNRLSKSGTTNENYAYDSIYRLISVVSNTPETFTYDPVGNRLTGPGAKDNAYLYNAGNQMSKGRQFSYNYDNNGNQVAQSIPAVTDKAWSLTWDFENRLVKMEKTKGATEKHTVIFKYDPFGRRIEKDLTTIIDGITKTSTWTYVYDNDNIALEIYVDPTGTAEKTWYTQGAGMDEHLALERSGNYYYYQADGLGSVTTITDQNKTIVLNYNYDSYGMVKPSTNFRNSYNYTGREWDKETGLYYYRARYYDPVDGRFISKDPIAILGDNYTNKYNVTLNQQLDSVKNSYSYVQNNPINYIDPTGLVVQLCYRPFRSFWGFLPVYHNYLIVGGIPYGYFSGSTLQRTDPLSGWGVHCVSITNDPCKEKCVRDKIKNFTPPAYNFLTYNCFYWASDVLRSCGL